MAAWFAALAPMMSSMMGSGGGGGGGGGGGMLNSTKGTTAALAPLAVGTAIYNMQADRELQRRNKKLLAELQGREASGNLGLGGAERESMAAAAMNPIGAALQQQQRRMDAMGTGAQMTSGADLAASREMQAGMMGQAAQQIAAQVYAADQARAQQEKNEIEARLALKTQLKRDDATMLTSAVASGVGATGALAGSAPGTMESAGMFGKLGTSEQAQMREFMEKYPDEMMSIYNEEAAKRAAAAAGATASAPAPAATTE